MTTGKFALCARGNLNFNSARDLVNSGEYSFEYKIDGVRAKIHISERGVDIFTRNGMSLASKFPDLVFQGMAMLGSPSKIRGLKSNYFLLDGELIMPSMKHRDIQAAIASNNPRAGDHVRFYAFDLLATPSRPELWKVDYLARKEELNSWCRTYFDVVTTNDGGVFQQAWDDYKEVGGEGFVLKKNNAAYTPGNSSNWLRAKYTTTLSVIPFGVNDDLTVDCLLWTGEGCGSVVVGSVQVPDDDLILILNKDLNCVLEITAYGVDEKTLKLRHPTYQGFRFEVDKTLCTVSQLEQLRSY